MKPEMGYAKGCLELTGAGRRVGRRVGQRRAATCARMAGGPWIHGLTGASCAVCQGYGPPWLRAGMRACKKGLRIVCPRLEVFASAAHEQRSCRSCIACLHNGTGGFRAPSSTRPCVEAVMAALLPMRFRCLLRVTECGLKQCVSLTAFTSKPALAKHWKWGGACGGGHAYI